MSLPDNQLPREAARAFTPELTALIEDPLYSEVWEDKRYGRRVCVALDGTASFCIPCSSEDEIFSGG